MQSLWYYIFFSFKIYSWDNSRGYILFLLFFSSFVLLFVYLLIFLKCFINTMVHAIFMILKKDTSVNFTCFLLVMVGRPWGSEFIAPQSTIYQSNSPQHIGCIILKGPQRSQSLSYCGYTKSSFVMTQTF